MLERQSNSGDRNAKCQGPWLVSNSTHCPVSTAPLRQIFVLYTIDFSFRINPNGSWKFLGVPQIYYWFVQIWKLPSGWILSVVIVCLVITILPQISDSILDFKTIYAVFQIETWAKTNFPSYHRGYFQEKRHFDFWRSLHHYVKSDSTPNENLQSSGRVRKN